MDDNLEVIPEPAMKGVSRRNFIKGVIAGGAVASSATYLFRASSLLGQQPPGLGERLITLNVNGQARRVDVMKQETLAWTLRYKLGLTGTKVASRAVWKRVLPVSSRGGGKSRAGVPPTNAVVFCAQGV